MGETELDSLYRQRHSLAVANAELAKMVVDLQFERDEAVRRLASVREWLVRFEQETAATPVNAEDIPKGPSVYNWREWFQRQLRAFLDEVADG